MEFGLFEILAITGSLAWSWPLIQWIVNISKKPELSLAAHKEVEIGFDEEGPYLDLELAFSAKNKDIFIDDAELIITHENQEIHGFAWSSFAETLLSMEIEDQKIPYDKTQRAIALNIPTESVIDKRVVFVDSEFEEQLEEVQETVDELIDNIKNSSDLVNQFTTSKEFNSLKSFYKDKFYWKVGGYNLTLTFTTNRDLAFKFEYNFKLTSRDVRKLEKNIKVAQDNILNVYLNNSASKVDWVTVSQKLKNNN